MPKSIHHVAKHTARQMGKAAMTARRKKAVEEMKKTTMGFRKDKTFDAAEKEKHKIQEPKRSDFPKGKAGDIQYKVAHRKWLEAIT